MSATWIAKPLFSLQPRECSLFQGIIGPLHPLSQTLEWASALQTSADVPFLVFCPERKISAVFLVSGTDAECVNGPVLNWERIHTARELNEQVSLVVYALHQSNPTLRNIRIRPRLLEEQYRFLNSNLAFPVDRVDEARTMILDLRENVQDQWFALPSRIRSEILRAERSGVQVSQKPFHEELNRFWSQTRDFYQKRNLFAPEETWLRALLLGHADSVLQPVLLEAIHPESGSQAEVLLLLFGKIGLYFFAHETRSESCPNVSLNACAQWEAIQICIRSGVRHYDLNGISASGADSGHRDSFQGVDFYKRRFKGREVSYFSPVICFGAG